MKVTYDFNLPEEQDDFDIYNNSMKYYLALCDLQQIFREWLKYEERESIPVDEIIEKFDEVLNDNEIYTLNG
jgi:hypothetical protein